MIKCDFCVSYNPYGKIKCLENTNLGRLHNYSNAIAEMKKIVQIKKDIKIGQE